MSYPTTEYGNLTAEYRTNEYCIKVTIEYDPDSTPFDADGITIIDSVPEFIVDSLYRGEFYIDHFDQTVYSKLVTQHEDIYIKMDDTVTELQPYYSKLGYAKHDAYLKTLEQFKNITEYYQNWLSDIWQYVCIKVEVYKLQYTEKDDQLWITDNPIYTNSMMGIEWHGLSSRKNQDYFCSLVNDLLPISLTKTELEALYNELE